MFEEKLKADGSFLGGVGSGTGRVEVDVRFHFVATYSTSCFSRGE